VSEVVRILVVDDESTHAQVLSELLTRAGYEVTTAVTYEEGLAILRDEGCEILITDLDLGAHRGTDLLREARRSHPDCEVMLISGVGSMEDALQAGQMGASHYFTKPLKVDEIRSVVARAVDRIRAKMRSHGLRQYLDDHVGFEDIIGQSPPMKQVFDTVRRIAPTSATVLIRGENGTGKELVAKAIHNLSPRRDEPFVALNCAALSEGVLESELFGHEKGAFTGAAAAREGKFEYANNGTLFLDEVGDMPLSVQVKLLRVVQEREIVRVGSNRTIKVDVRLIAATNRNLEDAIQEGKFREDLFYRLNVVRIDLPPLRDRIEDLPLLVRHFAREFAERHDREIVDIEPEAQWALRRYPWPGNVRELQNAVETMVLLSKGEVLDVESLPATIRDGHPATSSSTALVSQTDLASYTLQQWEKELIKLQLGLHEGNRARVARALGISERTLYRKLREYDLS
jgi:two-component system response regulator HydG